MWKLKNLRLCIFQIDMKFSTRIAHVKEFAFLFPLRGKRFNISELEMRIFFYRMEASTYTRRLVKIDKNFDDVNNAFLDSFLAFCGQKMSKPNKKDWYQNYNIYIRKKWRIFQFFLKISVGMTTITKYTWKVFVQMFLKKLLIFYT